MIEFLTTLFDGSDFVARSQCGRWTRELVTLHTLSDGVIWLSYTAIPIILIYFVRRRRDIPFPRIFVMFGAFIVLCGLTHLMDIVMFVSPVYRLAGIVKLATAGISLATAAALVPLVPLALALRSPKELEAVNYRLEVEIAERKKAEDALARMNTELREQEDFARSVTGSASDAIVCADARGVVVSWNRGAERTFGYTQAEILGQPLSLLMPERYRERHEEGLARLMRTGQSRIFGRTLELEGRRKDGTEFPLELCVDGWTARDQRFFTGIIRDITERKRRDGEILTLNRELESFSYSVSHDLRTPVRAIDGYSRILLEDHAERLDDEGRRILGVVIDSSRRMGNLIDDLLEFSRLGRTALRTSRIDMRELVEETLEDLRQDLAGRRVETKISALPPAFGDRALLKQVLLNLVGNAIKYSHPREVAEIEIGGSAAASEATYWVKDNGVGFDMAYAGKLFGVFQRLHSAEEFKGTGVGLALVQRVIHRHEGRIWAESAVDRGATFYFTLPRRDGGAHGDN
jgi:two-component system, LuxR family, sensor kinase FixL